MTSNGKAKRPRPLSPHLQVYDMLQITALLSISHRISGVFLSLGLLPLALWLWSAAYWPECFAWVNGLFASTLGQVAMVLWTFFLSYHAFNGVRHLFWDAGKGFAIPTVYTSGYAVVAAAFIMTAGIWFAVLGG